MKEYIIYYVKTTCIVYSSQVVENGDLSFRELIAGIGTVYSLFLSRLRKNLSEFLVWDF